jgi:protein-S-isoprenylcysteine O-methyltransferase Ste14
MKQKFFIDTHKGATAFFILLLMTIYDGWQNPTAWLYLALHGTYGLLWVLKSNLFPDQSWEEKTSLAYGVVIWLGLSLYWVAPWLLISNNVQAPGWYMSLCTSLYACGVFMHFASDMQKYTALQINPEQLITSSMFSKLRNPNYLGELLIYLGFGLLAMHWLPIAILCIWIVGVWIPRMQKKDKILAQLPGFEEYKKRSKLFIPLVF